MPFLLKNGPPDLSPDDVPDQGRRHAEFSREVALSDAAHRVPAADLFDGESGQFGTGASLALQGSLPTFGVPVCSVVGVRSEEQMFPANAVANVAAVADTETVGDGAIRKLPRDTVSRCAPPPEPEPTVALRGAISGPEPTRWRFPDFAKKLLGRRHTAYHTSGA